MYDRRCVARAVLKQCHRVTVRLSGQMDRFIVAYTALCLASYTDELQKFILRVRVDFKGEGVHSFVPYTEAV